MIHTDVLLGKSISERINNAQEREACGSADYWQTVGKTTRTTDVVCFVQNTQKERIKL